MSKIYNSYKNGVDRTWYDSSNIRYSECDDLENSLKNLRITFKDGRTYEYKDIDVNEYIMFRESSSQGQAFNKLIKKYACTKLDNKDLNFLDKELSELTESPKMQISIYSNKIIILSSNNNEEFAFNDLEELDKKLIEINKIIKDELNINL